MQHMLLQLAQKYTINGIETLEPLIYLVHTRTKTMLAWVGTVSMCSVNVTELCYRSKSNRTELDWSTYHCRAIRH